jgi:hypothetical protein
MSRVIAQQCFDFGVMGVGEVAINMHEPVRHL